MDPIISDTIPLSGEERGKCLLGVNLCPTHVLDTDLTF